MPNTNPFQPWVPLTKVGSVPVYAHHTGRAFTYTSGMNLDADGAPNAYHPKDIGTDFNENAGRPGNWWALATHNNQPSGNPVVQGPNDPAPGHYVSTTSLEDGRYPASDPRRYVDSSKVPYVVLPDSLMQMTGAKLGDYVHMMNMANGRQTAALVGDIGPEGLLGEGSMAAAKQLGLDWNPRSDNGGTGSGIQYTVFPGSGNGTSQVGNLPQRVQLHLASLGQTEPPAPTPMPGIPGLAPPPWKEQAPPPQTFSDALSIYGSSQPSVGPPSPPPPLMGSMMQNSLGLLAPTDPFVSGADAAYDVKPPPPIGVT